MSEEFEGTMVTFFNSVISMAEKDILKVLWKSLLLLKFSLLWNSPPTLSCNCLVEKTMVQLNFRQAKISPNKIFAKQKFRQTNFSPNKNFAEQKFRQTKFSPNKYFARQIFRQTKIQPNSIFAKYKFRQRKVYYRWLFNSWLNYWSYLFYTCHKSLWTI